MPTSMANLDTDALARWRRQVEPALERLVDPMTRGDPESPRLMDVQEICVDERGWIHRERGAPPRHPLIGHVINP